MTWENIGPILAGIATLTGSVWAIVKYYDTKQTKKKKEEMTKFEQLFKYELEPLNKQMLDTTEAISEIRREVRAHSTNLEQLGKAMNSHEISRLQTVIMDFARDLRNGHSATNWNDFNYVCHAYDEYKKLGGNSFVDAEFTFIERCKKEYDSLNFEQLHQ